LRWFRSWLFGRDPRKGEVDLALSSKCVTQVAIYAGRHLVDRIFHPLNADRPWGTSRNCVGCQEWVFDLEISQVCTWEIPLAYTQHC